jgi:hypothetical protein
MNMSQCQGINGANQMHPSHLVNGAKWIIRHRSSLLMDFNINYKTSDILLLMELHLHYSFQHAT